MGHRKNQWPHELECMQKAVNGGIDGYFIEVSDHYDDERYDSRGYTRIDIALAIFNGTIIELYSTEQNLARKSRRTPFNTPSRVILGKDSHGQWVIIVVGIVSSKGFYVVTCYRPEKARYLVLIKNENNM